MQKGIAAAIKASIVRRYNDVQRARAAHAAGAVHRARISHLATASGTASAAGRGDRAAVLVEMIVDVTVGSRNTLDLTRVGGGRTTRGCMDMVSFFFPLVIWFREKLR